MNLIKFFKLLFRPLPPEMSTWTAGTPEARRLDRIEKQVQEIKTALEKGNSK